MNTPDNRNIPPRRRPENAGDEKSEARRSAIEEMLKQTYNVEQVQRPKKEAPKLPAVNGEKPAEKKTGAAERPAAQRTSSTPTIPANQADMRSLYSTAEPKSSKKKSSSKTSNDGGSRGGKKGGSLFTNLMKAIVYVAFVLVVSGFAAYYIISFANDAFAFVKPDGYREIVFAADPDIDEVAEKLKNNGIIEHEGF